MTKIFCTYDGDGQTTLLHEPTADTITTDLPQDNGGMGRTFSPTDLFASALASCALTIMGKLAQRDKIDFTKASIEIDKIMATSPRRVGKFILKVIFPQHITALQKKKFMASIHSCPVHNSLSKEIEVELTHN